MRTKSSGSPRARASEVVLAALLTLTPVAQAAAQTAGGIVVVDMARVRGEAAAAEALRELELAERRALRQALDGLRESLEAEEAALAEARETLERDVFDVRVRAFEERVRLARRRAQEAGEALQTRFRDAERAFEARIVPVLETVMRDHGAVVAVDRAAVLAVGPGRDVTADLIRLLDEAVTAADAPALLPPRQDAPLVLPPLDPAAPPE